MKNILDAINDIRQKRKEFEQLKKDSPRIAGVITVNVLKENITIHHGFKDNGVQKWAERKPSTNKAYDTSPQYKGSVYSSSNPLLNQSKLLLSSFDYIVTGTRVKIGCNTTICPYAVHVNETRKIVGFSNIARSRIVAQFKKENEKIMSKYKK